MATKLELEQELKEKDNALSALQKQMEEMQKMMAQLASQSQSTPVQTNDKIEADEQVPVINLAVGELNISTEPNGNGVLYTFKEYGEVMDIPYADLKQICTRGSRSFAQEGLFYIMNEKAVEGCRLAQWYSRMLSDEQMMTLFEQTPSHVIELYKLASKSQKENIIAKIIDKKFSGERIDANVLMELGEMSGKDLMGVENPLDIPIKGEK